jgi:glycosyltransferase involved in cell wall biosynthesis
LKLVFFNRFFLPDASATSQMLSDLALDLARHGEEVHVVTSRVPGGEADEETIEGVTVHRVADAIAGPHGLARRALAYLGYYRGARRIARRIVSTGDVVVLKTDPPLLSAAIAPLAKERGARVVAWLQDLFPEVAQEYGLPAFRSPLGTALRRVRDRSLARSDAVVAISDAMGQRVTALGCVETDRLHVIHNWADGGAIVPIDGEANPLRTQWDLDGKFVVAYSGNLGRVHEFDTMLDAASRLREMHDVRFLVIGRGPRLAQVRARAQRESLSNVQFESPQERHALAYSLAVADVHLSILRPEFEGLVHPSKLYGILAAARPMIFIGSVTDETARIVREARCGLAIRSGDGRSLADAIIDLKADLRGRNAMGTNARCAFDAAYDMPIALAKWRSVLGLEGRIPSTAGRLHTLTTG